MRPTLASFRSACHWTATGAIKAAETLTVLGVFGVASYIGWWLVFGDVKDPRHDRMLSLLGTVSDNWKAFLLLAIPLFYRTVRTFLEEVQEAFGMKRPSRPAEAPGPATTNPPTP